MHESKLEELDLEAALKFATNALGNAAAFWIQCSADQKQRFQRVLFPNGLVFDGDTYRTAETCLVFSYLREISEGNSSLASQRIPTWNRIISWLQAMETIRHNAA
jgi:hypothetical protein